MTGGFRKRTITLFLAVAMTLSASASAICAVLCQYGACCAPPVPAAPLESCCKEKKLPAKASNPNPEPEKCCELMAERSASPEATLVKSFEPVFFSLMLPPTPVLAPVSAQIGSEAPICGNEVRGPPPPSYRPDAPRAPPMF